MSGKCFQKSRFQDTQVESDENDEDIVAAEKVMWKKFAPKMDFNKYVTYDDGLCN